MPPREVVITGVGVVSSIGIGLDAFRAALHAGTSGVKPITLFAADYLKQPFAGEVSDFDGKQYVRPRKSIKVMSRPIQLAFAAADMAMAQAGLAGGQSDPVQVEPDRFGVLLGSEFIYCDITEFTETTQACLEGGKFQTDRWYPQVEKNLNPLWMLKFLPNMAACHIGIAHDARGPNNSITSGGASSLLAMGEALRAMQRGLADVMLAGGSASPINPMHVLNLNTGELSQRRSDPAAACRPFDADRDGRVNGEGAGIFVFETREHAERRGAKPLARVLGFGSAFEAKATTGIRTGDGIRHSIKAALKDAGLTAADIGHVNADGLSTVDDDIVEARAIQSLLGAVAVTAPKSLLGDASAAAGAIEAVASLIAFEEGRIPPTRNYQRPDPRCPVNVVHGSPLAAERGVALLLNQSTTGQTAAIVLAAP